MIKKIAIPLLLIILVIIANPSTSNAYSVISSSDPGGVLKGSPFYYAEKDEVRIEYNGNSVAQTTWDFVETGTGRTFSKDLTAPDGYWYKASGFTCVGTYNVKIKSSSGSILATMTIKIDQGDLSSPKCESDASGDTTDGSDGPGEMDCNMCDLFACPGWGDFMGQLDQIKAAIPPVPNWPVVADTFRDSIAPKIKEDMAELIGTAPEPVMPKLPEPPELPPEPIMLEDVRKNIILPTGEEAPGLGESTFTEDDIKQSAPVIPEREDPTGGFKIDNPIDMLPSQDEFTKNAPVEGVAPIPGNPKDPENIAPTPGDTKDTAPIPGDTGNTAPIPGNTNNTAPIPNEGGKAPIPGDDEQFTAPIP